MNLCSIFETIHVLFLVSSCFWWGTGSSVTAEHVWTNQKNHFLAWESDVMRLRNEFCTQIYNTVMYNCTNWVKPPQGTSISFNRNPTANKPSRRSLHRSEPQGEAFQKQEELPKATGPRPSSSISHANLLWLLFLLRRPETYRLTI